MPFNSLGCRYSSWSTVWLPKVTKGKSEWTVTKLWRLVSIKNEPNPHFAENSPPLVLQTTNAHTVTMMFTGFANPIQDKHAWLLSAFSREQKPGTLGFKRYKAALRAGSRKQRTNKKNQLVFGRNQEENLKSCRQSQKMKFKCIHILWCLSYRELLNYHSSVELLKAAMFMFLPIPPKQ